MGTEKNVDEVELCTFCATCVKRQYGTGKLVLRQGVVEEVDDR